MQVLAAYAAYDEGGIGKFLAALVEAARVQDDLGYYFASHVKPNDPAGHALPLSHLRWFFRTAPLRWQHGARSWLAAELFDRAVARRIGSGRVFVGFAGSAAHSFQRARRLGFERLVLESPTSHAAHVRQQHQRSAAAYRIEPPWLNAPLYRKILREYEAADVITVSSEYAQQTFVRAGIAAEKMRRRVQPIAPRFAPAPRPHVSAGFRVVYVGRLQVTKGVPVLLEAFSRLTEDDAALTLVGGFATAGMERYTRRIMASDRRIHLRPGDPLPALLAADVLVHPSFEDGLGLAPLEALATGVPVIATEDTGMKEFVIEGKNGAIVPTGDIGALVDSLRQMRAHPLKGAFDPLRLHPGTLTPRRAGAG